MMIETARGTVHEWQRDHMGHINVRAYMEFFEEACWQFYAMLGMTPSLLRSGALHPVSYTHLDVYKRQIEHWRLLYGPEAVACMIDAEADHDNFRAAMRTGLESGGDLLGAGWITIFLLWFWYRRGYLQEGRVWSEQMMRATERVGGIPYGMALNLSLIHI